MNDRRNFLKRLMALAGGAVLSANAYGTEVLRGNSRNKGWVIRVIATSHKKDRPVGMQEYYHWVKTFYELKTALETIKKEAREKPKTFDGVEHLSFYRSDREYNSRGSLLELPVVHFPSGEVKFGYRKYV